MKIEILYFDGCPNHKPAVERVRQLLREDVSAEVLEVNVSDASIAQRVGFLGSPTVRVNGLDVEPEARAAREYGMMCRTLPHLLGGRPERRVAIARSVAPSDPRSEFRHQQFRFGSAPVQRLKKPTSLFAAGSVFAAIIASFCCILPIVFALTGVSILGASALFDAWRPYLLGLTFGLLGLGFYFHYRPRKEQCAPGSACAMPVTNRSGRLMLWLATATVVLFAAFPYYSGAVAEWLLSNRK